VVRTAALVAALGVLLVVVLLSLAVGAKAMPLHTVIDGLAHGGSSPDAIIVRDLRVPRTLLGLGVGAALGLAGALMQALTRNPLADPGILGVNAGASLAVVLGMAFLGMRNINAYVWMALAGAAIATLVVYAVGASGRGGATPVRLALSGTAITAVFTGVITAIILLDPRTFDQYRFWNVGALSGRDLGTVGQVAPFLVVGMVLALLLSRPLNAIALGEDTAQALGAHIGRTRVVGMLAVTLLCGAATAAAGPITFVGLTVPHIVRAITGPDQRWVLPYALVLSPVLLLGSDVLGRVLARPGELQVGIVTAFVGAPVFIALIRRRKLAQL
jgi:iron complex transport system permease protein